MSVGTASLWTPQGGQELTRHTLALVLRFVDPFEPAPPIASGSLLIESFPKKSVRIYTDGTGAVYNRESIAALKDFTTHNTPYVKASAVTGAEGLRMLAVNAAASVTGRQIKAFATRAEALDWLAAVN